jgi:hypothetical protein
MPSWLRLIAAAGLLGLVAACSGAGGHTAAARHAPGPGSRVPAAVAMRGTLNAKTATTVYEAAIAPAYPLAVQVADKLANHRASAGPAVSNFTSRLTKALASFSAVTGFPARAQPSFTAYRSQAAAVLALLAHPSALAASQTASKDAAVALYAFARQIGMLGTDLNMVPATEAGGKH